MHIVVCVRLRSGMVPIYASLPTLPSARASDCNLALTQVILEQSSENDEGKVSVWAKSLYSYQAACMAAAAGYKVQCVVEQGLQCLLHLCSHQNTNILNQRRYLSAQHHASNKKIKSKQWPQPQNRRSVRLSTMAKFPPVFRPSSQSWFLS